MPQNVSIRVQKYRDALRVSGLRPIQIWVVDTRRKGFRKECQRQSQLLKDDTEETNVLNRIESNFDDEGWK